MPKRKDALIIAAVLVVAVLLLLVSRLMPKTNLADKTADVTLAPDAIEYIEATVVPTEAPTAEPTAEATAEPTVEPTAEPTQAPTEAPAAQPAQAAMVGPMPAPQTAVWRSDSYGQGKGDHHQAGERPYQQGAYHA